MSAPALFAKLNSIWWFLLSLLLFALGLGRAGQPALVPFDMLYRNEEKTDQIKAPTAWGLNQHPSQDESFSGDDQD